MATPAAPANNNQNQQQGGFNFGGLLRLVVLWYGVSWFFKGTPKAVDPAGKVFTAPHKPIWEPGQAFQFELFLNDEPEFLVGDHSREELDKLLVWKEQNLLLDWDPRYERALNITIGQPWFDQLLNNGTLYGHVVFTKKGLSYREGDPTYNRLGFVTASQRLNVYKVKPKLNAKKNLLSGEFADERVQSLDDVLADQATPTEYTSFWKPMLNFRLVHDFTVFSAGGVPKELEDVIHIDPRTGHYFPSVYFDFFWFLSSQLVALNESVTELQLQCSYSPISLFKWRIEAQMEQSWKMQESLGSSESETEEFKRMLLETNPYFLVLTFVVSMLHMVFDFLAFKNDIAFWKQNKSMEGLSLRTIVMNTGMQVVVFLYLLDNDTSWMILFSSGIGLFIEGWKIRKAADVTVLPKWPYISIKGKSNYDDSPTAKYDREAMAYLSYVLYPAVACYAVYALVYEPQKSWYSWILNSLTGCVYTFGFIMMCPQLYLNYKLKSVAHLPWRMLTYKALNTFIDDLFAFIIKMPTLHRLSCFRDDVIFFIFLYQKWKYRVDYARPNEFGFVVPKDAAAEAELKAKAEAEATQEQQQQQQQQQQLTAPTPTPTAASSSSATSSSSPSSSSSSTSSSASSGAASAASAASSTPLSTTNAVRKRKQAKQAKGEPTPIATPAAAADEAEAEAEAEATMTAVDSGAAQAPADKRTVASASAAAEPIASKSASVSALSSPAAGAKNAAGSAGGSDAVEEDGSDDVPPLSSSPTPTSAAEDSPLKRRKQRARRTE